MKYTKLRLVCCVTVLLFISSGLFAVTFNDDPELLSLYAKGERLMKEGAFYDAANLFEELAARFPNSPNLDLVLFQRAKANYYDLAFSEAIAGFKYYIGSYPDAAEAPYAYFFLGNAYYRNDQVRLAIDAYSSALQFSQEQKLDDLVITSLKSAFANAGVLSLTEADFSNISGTKRCRVLTLLADEYVTRADIKKAERLLSICGETVDPDVAGNINTGSGNKPFEIAVVVPFSGELEPFGQMIYNGAVIASEQYRAETGKQIVLTPYDTKGDPIEAARIISNLAEGVTTDLVIGPLTSEEASVASAILHKTALPMIAPAATEAGLTRLSTSAFQLAPNIELEGITLAEYAVHYLNADSAVIISSTVTEDIRMSRAFARRFKMLGGTVAAIQYYRSRDKDFGMYIRDLKRMIIGGEQDSTFYITPDGDTLDWDVLPVDVDCIFMPGNPTQLRQLVPQVNFYNVSGFFLGSDGWGDNAVYRMGDNVTKNAVFASPFLESKRSDAYLQLAADYDSRYGEQPQRLATLGYDAVQLATNALHEGPQTRESLIDKLSRVTSYNGASGMISFGEFRENIEMPLYQIQNEQAAPVTTVQ